jgi:hypothetical protein
VAGKGAAKSKDEAKRAEVTAKIGAIYAAAEADVKKILDGIDPKVEAAFDAGEKQARSAFESFVAAKMSAYKKDRYGGWLGGLRWAKDKLLGMPSKVNEFYEAGREIYLKQMDGVISRVADIVGGDLGAAKARIAAGKNEIAAYVKTLPGDLAKVGAEASSEIGEKFTALEGEVDAKQEALVDTLASKYVEARSGLDARIEELQAENAGLVDKAIGAIKAVIGTIRELVAMLTGVLARAAGVIGDIIKNPVGFLGNLIAGVKGGILRFKDNILTHLRKGLFGWLFGALAEGGVELPEKFDAKGIIKLLASLFGLTWTNIRNRLIKQIGEKAMGAAEKGVEIFQLLAGGGVAALWQMLVEKLGDIKEMILEQVKDFVITKIITAGITWLIGLLNPAAAFIKACKLIYDVIMFFVTNGSRIMAFVNTVIDSVTDIVKGNVSGVVEKIENVLGQMVPIIIGFLASVIGLGGIGQKIRQIVETLQKPVNKALDFVIKQGLKLAAPLIRGLTNLGSKAKAKAKAGADWVRGKAAAGKAWATEKAAGVKAKLTGTPTPAEKEKAAIADADRALAASTSHADAERRVGQVRGVHSVPLKLVVESRDAGQERVHVQTMSTDSHDIPGDKEEESEEVKLIDDGSTSVEERRKVLADVRAVVQNEAVIKAVLDVMRAGQMKKANRVGTLQKLIKLGEKDGYRLTFKEKQIPGEPMRLHIDYFGVFKEQTIKVGTVRPGGMRPIGYAQVEPKSVGTGESPVPALTLDFIVDPKIEEAGVKGVGSKLFTIAAEHYKTQYQAVSGDWYTLQFYAHKGTGRPGMSTNLVQYIEARRAGASPEAAVRATWTYSRVKKLYGDVELEVTVEELPNLDFDNLPADERIVSCLMKPR